MIANQTGSPHHTGQPTSPVTFTLEPLRSQGRDALSTHDAPGLLKITLRELEIRWQTGSRHVTTHKARDIFDCHDTNPSPIPAKGQLAYASFQFLPEDSLKPFTIQIRPPHRITVHPPAKPKWLDQWLETHHFKLPPGTIAILIALATTAAALSPDLDTDDDDDPLAEQRSQSHTLPC